MKIRKAPKTSPWGKVDISKQYHDDVMFVGTPSHGGFKVYTKSNKLIPEVFRRKDGWYEEDCEWSIPAMFVHGLVDKLLVEKHEVDATLRNWYPDAYEAHFKVTLKQGESYIKDRREHKEKNKDNFMVSAAWGDWEETVPEGMVGVTARRQSDGTEKAFLVPDAEYSTRSSFGFVVDKEKHKEWKNCKHL